MDLEADPVATGLAASLARPGGNITGIFLDAAQLNGEWLELLRGVIPRLKRVAALWDATMLPLGTKAGDSLERRTSTLEGHVVKVEPGQSKVISSGPRSTRRRSDTILV